MMDSTSYKYVHKVSSVNILPVDIARNAHFTDFITTRPWTKGWVELPRNVLGI